MPPRSHEGDANALSTAQEAGTARGARLRSWTGREEKQRGWGHVSPTPSNPPQSGKAGGVPHLMRRPGPKSGS